MKDLISLLKDQTRELREEYLQKTAQWAEKQVAANIERRERYFKGALAYSSKGDYWTDQRWFYRASRSIFSVEEFVPKAVKDAEAHYEQSIAKLADRIVSKGLDLEKISVKTAKVDVNITTTITDGEKTVRAFTIVAWGEIQRPHYRYLIK